MRIAARARILTLVVLASPLAYGQAPPSGAPAAPGTELGAGQAQSNSEPPNQDRETGQSELPSPPALEQASVQATAALDAGKVIGTVTDENDDAIPGASVSLQSSSPEGGRAIVTNDKGFFEIAEVKPGVTYHVTITAEGFASWTSPDFVLEPGEHKILAVGKLKIEEVTTAVVVKAESAFEIATEQVRVEEKQRAFGIIPNFFEVYDPNPAPLTTRLKFKLAFRVAIDPATFAGVGFLAGLGQAADSPNYVQGTWGFSERFGANYANNFTDIMISGAVLPSLLRQDPRYFYQGTGTKKSRLGHAIASLFIAKGDNGRRQVNYSSLGADLGSAALSNLYYPASNRGAALVFQNFGVNTAAHAGVRLLQEFIFHPPRQRGSQS